MNACIRKRDIARTRVSTSKRKVSLKPRAVLIDHRLVLIVRKRTAARFIPMPRVPALIVRAVLAVLVTAGVHALFAVEIRIRHSVADLAVRHITVTVRETRVVLRRVRVVSTDVLIRNRQDLRRALPAVVQSWLRSPS